jgi:hypothetical protein
MQEHWYDTEKMNPTWIDLSEEWGKPLLVTTDSVAAKPL